MSNESYHLVTVDDVETEPDRPDIDPEPDPIADSFSISAETGLEILGLRTYAAEPGEQLPLAYHYHETQEEAFYVLDGTLHVETPEKEYVVRPGQLFAAEGGSPHRAHVPEGAGEPVRVLAIGAPSDDTGRVYDPDDDS
ncbi:cupin domain-containing protein [Natrarchaeobius oligotrophus]|uniref:Cupin domain-containing protein n=1 Tax=Natrarchaeobius chitinivorans TaxID=1679083 RepID=A0A3N6PKS5_NATCH|nr:cupin domain-containing protein [Natrarchaeobius chitinivorans]RQG99425.1 cupin domain-containing protein [Natrarchaeobius chitinivorans]